ncbi:hypothetical protein SCHPADRAFT_600280 [Schizopora paradoxa]|uniref:Uncharacterized protein n=1 Tax=Schizopora paradoxa TaxID=27342 RepID=A0A0H2RGI0_9AGAM|nr:hypothetical protein SCHPADRAFT_600280 [Schizopora paradoxa]
MSGFPTLRDRWTPRRPFVRIRCVRGRRSGGQAGKQQLTADVSVIYFGRGMTTRVGFRDSWDGGATPIARVRYVAKSPNRGRRRLARTKGLWLQSYDHCPDTTFESHAEGVDDGLNRPSLPRRESSEPPASTYMTASIRPYIAVRLGLGDVCKRLHRTNEVRA